MPIYEFYCNRCNIIYNFLARSVNTRKKPNCPRCKKVKLQRQVSLFSMARSGDEGAGPDDLPVDEAKMERAMETLAHEAEGLNEDDPRQAAKLMRKFSDMTGMEFKGNMEEALRRMESGEDPEAIEAEMGDLLEEEEEAFVLADKGKAGPVKKRPAPERDLELYEL